MAHGMLMYESSVKIRACCERIVESWNAGDRRRFVVGFEAKFRPSPVVIAVLHTTLVFPILSGMRFFFDKEVISVNIEVYSQDAFNRFKDPTVDKPVDVLLLPINQVQTIDLSFSHHPFNFEVLPSWVDNRRLLGAFLKPGRMPEVYNPTDNLFPFDARLERERNLLFG